MAPRMRANRGRRNPREGGRGIWAPYGHPGKFEGEPIATELLYDASMESGEDEQLGESDGFGWFALFDGIELGKDNEKVYAILSENSQGFVSGEYFDTRAQLLRAWKTLERDYEDYEQAESY